jgi:hypothetical protein
MEDICTLFSFNSYTVSTVEYGFDGYIVGDDNSLLLNYRNSQTSTVLNPEIKIA